MKMIIVLAAVLALAVAAPYDAQDAGRDAVITAYDSDNIGVDGYSYSFQTSDGVSKTEQGQLKTFDNDAQAITSEGTYSYVGADGQTYTVSYKADENGFQPEGDHLPKA